MACTLPPCLYRCPLSSRKHIASSGCLLVRLTKTFSRLYLPSYASCTCVAVQRRLAAGPPLPGRLDDVCSRCLSLSCSSTQRRHTIWLSSWARCKYVCSESPPVANGAFAGKGSLGPGETQDTWSSMQRGSVVAMYIPGLCVYGPPVTFCLKPCSLVARRRVSWSAFVSPLEHDTPPQSTDRP